MSLPAVSPHARTLPRKPSRLLDRSMSTPSGIESAGFIGYAAALYVLPLALMYGLASGGTAWYAWAAAFPLVMLSGYGLFLLATTGHEAFHFNLARDRMLSCYVGCLASAMLPLFCATGFFVYHWQHHRSTNSDADPDHVHFSRYRSAPARMFIARLAITARYLSTTLRVARFGINIGIGAGIGNTAPLPLGDKQLQRLAQFNLLCQLAWIACYVALSIQSPDFAMAWVAVLCATTVISSMNAYQEHAFAEPVRSEPAFSKPAPTIGHADTFARSRTSLVLTLLHAGSNYHVEHHLYPSVPCWRLPRVHRLLVERGWYAGREHLLDSGLVGTLRYCSTNYRYGGPRKLLQKGLKS